MEQHWTEEEDAKAVPLFDRLPVTELHRRLELCRQQQMRAFDRKDGRALTDLQRMEQSLIDAVLRKNP